MANPNDWSQFYNNNSNNQPFFTTSTTVSTAVTTTAATGEATSMDSRLSLETGRVTKPTRRRSRASRRTPTTLLNTDTSNFRAMVQQFTGGPSAMAFGSGNNTTGFSLTSSSDPSAGSSHVIGQQQTPWQYNFQPHAPPLPQRPYMFSLSNVNPVVGYCNLNNPTGLFGTADGGGGGGSAPSPKEGTNSSASSSRLQ